MSKKMKSEATQSIGPLGQYVVNNTPELQEALKLMQEMAQALDHKPHFGSAQNESLRIFCSNCSRMLS